MITDEMVWRAALQYTATAHESDDVHGFSHTKAIRAALEAALAAMPQEPVGYLFELCYSHEHDRWSGTMYGTTIPDPKDVRNVRPLFASPAQGATAPSEEDDLRAAREAAKHCYMPTLWREVLAGECDHHHAVQAAIMAIRTERAKGAA